MADQKREFSACGVGLVASLRNQSSHKHLLEALEGLIRVEHRGGVLADGRTGDGAGIMAEVPFELLGHSRGSVAVATLFIGLDTARRKQALQIFEDTLDAFGLKAIDYRRVPTNTAVLGHQARETLPTILQAFIGWPEFCRTELSFNTRLHLMKQALRTQLARANIVDRVFMVSLSTRTIVYKALVTSELLPEFYPDLKDPHFSTRFALFHRRFSTNTKTSWEKAQPFRMIAHNGEINTIACNLSWGYAYEHALGLPENELLTHRGFSDSANLNEMVEALRYRSSIPHLSEVLAIMVPPANSKADFYKFWSRAVEPWDGPAFLAYADGETVGARLDRNGFRPCRWTKTKDAFYLASETGLFDIPSESILAKGHLRGGTGAHVELSKTSVHFLDPAEAKQNHLAQFDARLEPIGEVNESETIHHLENLGLFSYTQEEYQRQLLPMITSGKEAVGSMGDTAALALLSDQQRSFFDYFYQGFAQVTNPPLDAIREKNVTDLTTYLGRRPNVFEPKQLLPLMPGIELQTPILSLREMNYIRQLHQSSQHAESFEVAEFSCTFPRVRGAKGLQEALEVLEMKVLAAIRAGCTILVLSDRKTKYRRMPIPSLLALASASKVLTEWGNRLDASIIVDTADARNSHQVAALIGFGASAVCPYMALELARHDLESKASQVPPVQRERNLRAALGDGLLKVMSKVGISTVRGYQGSKLFTSLGIGKEILERYFSEQDNIMGGINLTDLAAGILNHTEHLEDHLGLLPTTFQLREHRKGIQGEKHSMTAARSKLVHSFVKDRSGEFKLWKEYQEFVDSAERQHPISPRHLLSLRSALPSIPIADVQPREEILRRFGSGAMSFGAISAESQRDIIKAMEKIGGRSASGEGGENPYYFVDGTTATIKQVASGRFGVTAEYLIGGKEIEIKMAQGAKPGEGGQLMANKVDEAIAKARHSSPGVDLISPPPLHDVYSIEDLRELIYELKQLKSGIRVTVKLVSGANIGAISAGVVKAGADTIQISGGDGGTGAALLTSMRHAGLPWEIGLAEVHQTLTDFGLREHVSLRVDGGLQSALDIIVATALGAEEFSFGKLLLIAEGCIMARICEKNTCPRGIATHSPKFKAKYRGSAEDVVTLLEYLAEDIRQHLARLGYARLDQLLGRADLIEPHPAQAKLLRKRNIDLSAFRKSIPYTAANRGPVLREGTSRLNQRIIEDVRDGLAQGGAVQLEYSVRNTDRALLTTLSGYLAQRTQKLRKQKDATIHFDPGTIKMTLKGSAGQGLAAFLVAGVEVHLRGEANDSVCKSMSGGKLIVSPPPQINYLPRDHAIIGNGALYGATGGTLFVHGGAGDRFAVRNSGAIAVVESVGLHAAEYMTGGTAVILGAAADNVGAGMTGGKLFLKRSEGHRVNRDYLVRAKMKNEDEQYLRELLEAYLADTQSSSAENYLSDASLFTELELWLPKNLARAPETAQSTRQESTRETISV